MGVNFHRRPQELANDTATNRDFMYEFLQKHNCDYVVMFNPTSPALRQETVNSFIEYLQSNDFDTILSVAEVKAEAFFKNRKVNFDGQDKIPSQLLEPIHFVVWAMTAWKRDTFIKLQESNECPIFGGEVGQFVIPGDESVDLDTEEDWRVAEALLLVRENKFHLEAKYLDL